MLPFALLLFATSTFASSQPSDPGYEPVLPGTNVFLDRVHLTPRQKEIVRGDFRRLQRLDISAPHGSLFEKVFGGTSGEAVLRYFNDRLRYITVTDSADDPRKGTYGANYASDWLLKFSRDTYGIPEPASYWTHPFERGEIQIDAPRIGYLNLGTLYSGSNDTQKSIGRIDTLVHEARHSDCARVPGQEDLELYRQDKDMSPEGRACYHLHVDCGVRSGSGACDDEPFGSYGVAYIFDKAIWQYCRNCRDSQIQEAAAAAADNLSRLKDEARKILRRAWMGRPDPTDPSPNMSGIR